MKITNNIWIESNNPKYDARCESFETQTGWGHIARIIENETMQCVGYYKINYYNRTWERYQYQSAILGAIDDMLNDYKEEWKETNNVKRFTEKTRNLFNNDEHTKEIKAMYEYFLNEYRG